MQEHPLNGEALQDCYQLNLIADPGVLATHRIEYVSYPLQNIPQKVLDIRLLTVVSEGKMAVYRVRLGPYMLTLNVLNMPTKVADDGYNIGKGGFGKITMRSTKENAQQDQFVAKVQPVPDKA